MDKIQRLLNLTIFLLDTRRPVTFEELRETVYAAQPAETPGQRNALHKMFERDKEELRDMGVEITVEKPELGGDEGYIISRDTYYLPKVDLDPGERLALAVVSRFFLGSGTPFSGPAQTALLKLVFDEEGVLEDLPHLHWVESPSDRQALDAVLDGLLRRKLVRFSYRALDSSEPMDREVEPYGLFNRAGYWYLVGCCHNRGEMRCFKLDRISSDVEVNRAKPRTPDFTVPDGFELSKEIPWEWPPASGVEDIESRVLFSPGFAFARESAPARLIGEKRMSDGGLETEYEVADPEQFVEWALGFGTGAVIKSPAELREMARSRLEGVLEGLSAG